MMEDNKNYLKIDRTRADETEPEPDEAATSQIVYNDASEAPSPSEPKPEPESEPESEPKPEPKPEPEPESTGLMPIEYGPVSSDMVAPAGPPEENLQDPMSYTPNTYYGPNVYYDPAAQPVQVYYDPTTQAYYYQSAPVVQPAAVPPSATEPAPAPTTVTTPEPAPVTTPASTPASEPAPAPEPSSTPEPQPDDGLFHAKDIQKSQSKAKQKYFVKVDQDTIKKFKLWLKSHRRYVNLTAIVGVVFFVSAIALLVLILNPPDDSVARRAEAFASEVRQINADAEAVFKKDGADATVKFYQRSINANKSQTEKAQLYAERAAELMVLCDRCHDQALADLVRSDELNPTYDSARRLFVFVLEYGSREQIELYQKTLKDRSPY